MACAQAAAAALSLPLDPANCGGDDSLSLLLQRLKSAAAAHPACRKHASFSSNLWLQQRPASLPPDAAGPPLHFTASQLQQLRSASSYLFSDTRAREAAAALRLRLILSSCPHAISPLPSVENMQPPRIFTSSDALVRALAVTSGQLQCALRALEPSLPTAFRATAGANTNIRCSSNSSSSNAVAAAIRRHVMGAVPDRGGRPNDLNDRTVARDVSSANAALKGQVSSHVHAKGHQLPAKRQFQGGDNAGRKR
jgi:hypothetical protein